jgi:hypothetical protein
VGCGQPCRVWVARIWRVVRCRVHLTRCAALELHVCSDIEKSFHTQDECGHGDFGAVLEGSGEGNAKAVSERIFAVRGGQDAL